MNELYDKILNKVFKRDKLKEWCTRYYGEEHREYINKRLDSVDVLLYAENIFSFRIVDLFKREGLKKGYLNWYEDSQTFLNSMRFLFNIVPQKDAEGNLYYGIEHYQEMDVMQNLMNQYSESIEALGFDFDSVEQLPIKNDKNNSYQIKDTFFDVRNETIKEFVYYATTGMNNIPQFNGVFDQVEEFEHFYNKNVCKGLKPLFFYSHQTQDIDFLNQTFDDIPAENYLDKNVQYKFLDFSHKDEKLLNVYLRDVLFTKWPIGNLNGEAEQYFLKCVNYIFDTTYTTIQEFIEDKTVFPIVETINSADIAMRQALTASQLSLYVDSTKQRAGLKDAIRIFNTTNTRAYYSESDDLIALPLSNLLSMNDVVHESNHALSLYVEGEIKTVGFDIFERTEPFNEIVNEFLTLQIMKNVTDEEIAEFSLPRYYACNYRTAVDFMQDFLLCFEDVLKDCQMGKTKEQAKKESLGECEKTPNRFAQDILVDVIGQGNYDTLIILTSQFAEYDYGKFKTKRSDKEMSAQELIDAYETTNYAYDEKEKDVIYWLLKLKNFCNQMVEMYKAVKTGEKKTFEYINVKENYEILLKPNITAVD